MVLLNMNLITRIEFALCFVRRLMDETISKLFPPSQWSKKNSTDNKLWQTLQGICGVQNPFQNFRLSVNN